MVTTIEQVIHPLLFIVCYIITLDFYPRKQPRSQWIRNLSIIYCVTFWFAYVYVYYTILMFIIKLIGTTTARLILEQYTIFTSIIFAIISRYHRKRFIICLKKLAIVDDSLEELGTPKMYHKIRMWSKILIIGWLIYSISINFYESFWQLQKKETVSWALYAPLVLNYPFHINILMDLLFISVLWYIGTRFDKVNEHMQNLLVRKKHGQRCTWKKCVITHHRYVFYTDNYKRTLWILMHVHLELCRLARELNSIFGIQIILEMASCFFYLTIICHILCWLTVEYKIEDTSNVSLIYYEYFYIIVWTFSHSLKFFTMNYMCEKVSLKANEIDKIIHELSNISRYGDVCKEIYQFMLQTTYHQLKFTGMGFFYLGNSLLRKLCTTIVTFVIIFKQMKIYL